MMKLVDGAAPAVALALLLCTPGVVTSGVAAAEPGTNPTALGELIADVAEANQRLQDLGADIQAQQEGVNKALVDVQTARDNATAAQAAVDSSAQGVKDADAAIDDAQRRFDTFAAASYMAGPASSYLTATSPDDIIASATAGQTLAASSQQVMTNLQRARTEQVNKESMARLAKQEADQATVDAQTSQDDAVAALTAAQAKFSEQQTQVTQLAAERDTAKARLAAARTVAQPGLPAPSGASAAAPVPTGSAAAPSADWDRSPSAKTVTVPYGDVSEWDTTLPAVPSAFVSGDPIAIVNAVLQISATSLQVTSDLGRNFLTRLGILKPADTGINNGAIPRVYGAQAVEYVIQRGLAQRGVPYSWGGGNAAGASYGIDSGSGTKGFDCSGLMLYMFAGVGIKLDHYSGSQYNAGRKIPSSQMRRGDMIFYGPNASQHVAMFLGDGQMLEAPYTGSVVKVSPVRTSGMTPYVTRMIEW